jgi:hypothetical protein
MAVREPAGLDPMTLIVDRVHHHLSMLREVPTYLGVLLLAFAWIIRRPGAIG